MPGPASAGLFVYAKDFGRLASFYLQVVGMARIHASPDLVVLEAQGLVSSLGGEVFPETRNSHAMDPEGNVFQLRQSSIQS